MGNSNDSFIGRLIKTLEFLIALYGLIMVFCAGCITLYRIPFQYRRYRTAQTLGERQYFFWKFLACCTGGYAFVMTLMLFTQYGWFTDYWPALCSLWTYQGGFGEVGHHDAVAGDIGLCLLACPLFHLWASTLGKLRVDCDGDEMFLPSTG